MGMTPRLAGPKIKFRTPLASPTGPVAPSTVGRPLGIGTTPWSSITGIPRGIQRWASKACLAKLRVAAAGECVGDVTGGCPDGTGSEMIGGRMFGVGRRTVWESDNMVGSGMEVG